MPAAIFGIDYIFLDRCGIFINFLAGIFLASEYFMDEERFKSINIKIDSTIESQYNKYKESLVRTMHDKHVVYTLLKKLIMIVSFFIAFDIGGYVVSKELPNLFSWTIILIRDSFFMLLLNIFIFLLIFIVLLILHKIHNLSPKGTLGAIGIALYFVGTILQFLSTFN